MGSRFVLPSTRVRGLFFETRLKEQSRYLAAFGFGLPCFSSFEAAAVFCVARRVALLCGPAVLLQLPFVPGRFPGVGSKPGQQRLLFLALARLTLFFAPVDRVLVDRVFAAV